MKSLIYYINESLNSKTKKFFDNVFKSQEKLVEDNDIETINIEDIKYIKKLKAALSLEDLKDKSILNIIDNKLFGFPIASQIIKNIKRFLNDNAEAKCYAYFYNKDKITYLIGLVFIDEKTIYIDKFLTTLLIEPSNILQNTTKLYKAILIDLAKDYKSKFIGLVIKPSHPKIKAIATKLGFNSFKDNKELMTIKL